MPHLDLTITLGNLIEMGGIVVALIGMYFGLVRQVDGLKLTLDTHAATLTDHSTKMEQHDSMLIALVGDVREIMGRIAPDRRREAR